MAERNADARTVAGFGDEWTRFDQSALSEDEIEQMARLYFGIFPWSRLPVGAEGFDLGCGSGRWALCVAPRVGRLHCVDASPAALTVARRNLQNRKNCEFHEASVEAIPLPDASMDFGYSLGVLHHVPDTAAGLRACVRKLKRGAPFLLYLYYSFDNRPAWYRLLWEASELLRASISHSPSWVRHAISDVLAAAVYFPLARLAWGAERLGLDAERLPLSFYRHRRFYTMRTDALDRFGTRLERRFSREQILRIMEEAGLEKVAFSESMPYWVAVGFRSPELLT